MTNRASSHEPNRTAGTDESKLLIIESPGPTHIEIEIKPARFPFLAVHDQYRVSRDQSSLIYGERLGLGVSEREFEAGKKDERMRERGFWTNSEKELLDFITVMGYVYCDVEYSPNHCPKDIFFKGYKGE